MADSVHYHIQYTDGHGNNRSFVVSTCNKERIQEFIKSSRKRGGTNFSVEPCESPLF